MGSSESILTGHQINIDARRRTAHSRWNRSKCGLNSVNRDWRGLGSLALSSAIRLRLNLFEDSRVSIVLSRPPDLLLSCSPALLLFLLFRSSYTVEP
jgi:hypothetical protein